MLHIVPQYHTEENLIIQCICSQLLKFYLVNEQRSALLQVETNYVY